MLKIDRANRPKINEEKILEAILGNISISIVRIISNTHRTRTNESLCINNLQKFL